MLQVALRCIARFYRKETGRRGGRTGSVTAIQRFGSALQLNLTPPFGVHIVHLDGVYDRGADACLRFFHASPKTEDVERVVKEIGIKAEKWLAKQGHGGEFDDSNPSDGSDDDDVHEKLLIASMRQRVASEDKPVKKVKRVQVLGGKERPLGPNCAVYEGYNLHADVALAAMDRLGVDPQRSVGRRKPPEADRPRRT